MAKSEHPTAGSIYSHVRALLGANAANVRHQTPANTCKNLLRKTGWGRKGLGRVRPEKKYIRFSSQYAVRLG